MVGLAHNGDGALADERDRHHVGAHAVARDAAGGVGGVEEGRQGWLGRAQRRSARSPSRYNLSYPRCHRPIHLVPHVSSRCSFGSVIA